MPRVGCPHALLDRILAPIRDSQGALNDGPKLGGSCREGGVAYVFLWTAVVHCRNQDVYGGFWGRTGRLKTWSGLVRTSRCRGAARPSGRGVLSRVHRPPPALGPTSYLLLVPDPCPVEFGSRRADGPRCSRACLRPRRLLQHRPPSRRRPKKEAVFVGKVRRPRSSYETRLVPCKNHLV